MTTMDLITALIAMVIMLCAITLCPIIWCKLALLAIMLMYSTTIREDK